MPIPEAQLETWAHQGAVSQSKDTYATVRGALEAAGTGYADKSFSIFLQGSYCNDTNVYAESDVDIVILTDATYYYDLGDTPSEQKAVFQQGFIPASYPYSQFKTDVVAALKRTFGSEVKVGNKAITVEANANRRKADVIAAMEFRSYYAAQTSIYFGTPAPLFHKGICFYTTSGEQIVNYPKQHSENLTRKHGATQGWLKPTCRILKNWRNRLVAERSLPQGAAPSYFLEGMLYNVPNYSFGRSYQATVAQSIDWLLETDHSQLTCANERYYLVRDNARNCWPVANYNLYLSLLAQSWNEWR